jgi:predicted nucleotidyltransferase
MRRFLRGLPAGSALLCLTVMNEFEAIESYYIETRDGCYFAVKGLEHPPDRRIAVLRYIPDPDAGDRVKNGVRYRRLYGFAEQEAWIRRKCPRYLAYDPFVQATLQSVPLDRIRRVYDPVLRLRGLTGSPTLDPLAADAVAFLAVLQKEAAVSASALGVTGSLLIGLQTEHSDMDVAVFGEASCIKVRRALGRLIEGDGEKDVRRLDAAGMEELYAQRSVDTRIGFPDFVYLEGRKANQGLFRGRPWFVRFIRTPDETGTAYGKRQYTPLGRGKVRATVAWAGEAIFTPCRYVLSEVQNAGVPGLPDPDEIVSFRGRFCEQGRAGDRVAAEGTLERVRSSSGETYHRLLLGNSPEDSMIVMR